MISASTLVPLLVSLVIAGVVFWLIWWFVGYIGLPEPFNKVARVLIGLAALLYLLNLLMSLSGTPLFR